MNITKAEVADFWMFELCNAKTDDEAIEMLYNWLNGACGQVVK